MTKSLPTRGDVTVSKEEFAEIYDSHAERIYGFIYYKTLHRETAEDLTSHTFLNALEHLHQYDPGKGSITVWLYQIARNLVTDHFRKKSSTVNIEDVWDIASAEDVESEVGDKVRIEELKAALGKLPSEQRDIVILRVWQDLPYSEIARIMEKSEPACKMMFSRVIARLKDEFVLVGVMCLLFVKILK
jgi:RNA polymerase sigma-70 factor (ECF subfamily)